MRLTSSKIALICARVLSRKMIINTKVFVIVALVICGVYARTADNRDFYKETNDRKYAGSMLTEIAKELMQRSATSSQVLK